MFSLVYVSSIFGVVGCGAALIVINVNINRFFGWTLSQWIENTSRKDNLISAEKLLNVRKHLEVLAHDVLKHRILGLASLIQEVRQASDDGTNVAAIPEDKQLAFRQEFFRLSGLKISAEERLWTRWADCFRDIFQYTSRNTVVPPVDPMFSKTCRELVRLRGLMTAFVKRESSNTVFLSLLLRLDFEQCVDVYPKVLALANACRMIVDPDDVVKKAIDAVASQTKRGGLGNRIEIFNSCSQNLYCTASTRLLVMCLTRLLDNALEISEKIAVDVEFQTDDFTGESSLLFKVYDQVSTIPEASSYGMGIRGICQNIGKFDGGLQFRKENRGEFKKVAIVSFPAQVYSQPEVTRIRWGLIAVYALANLLALFGFIFCLLYAVGGPPVEFAGKGEAITEFTVKAGQELVIPLCMGGRNVRAEVSLANEACVSEDCSFGDILQALEPCAQSINDPQCPGEIRWTPRFDDGLRQGKNYELTVHCISDGPPGSDDLERIRVLVFRENSEPRVLLTQLINETRGEVYHVLPGQTIKTGVTDDLQLHVMATDGDTDNISYRLRAPGGKVTSSRDGVFMLEEEWSTFGTATYELEVSDNVAPPIKIPVILEADELHPIELRNVSLWDNSGKIKYGCDGSSESRICHLPDPMTNVLEVQLWFDPIQQRIRPQFAFQISDVQGFDVKTRFSESADSSKPGDQWEFYSRQSKQLVGVIELTNIEKTQTPGLYNCTFTMMTMPTTIGISSIGVNMLVSEYSERMQPMRSTLIMTRGSQDLGTYSFNTRHVELTEYDDDGSDSNASISAWIYPNRSGVSVPAPKLGNITCITPEFEEGFEKPVLRDTRNAWRVDLRLKKGCIPGLSQSMPGKSRLCSIDVFGEDKDHPDPIWIALNPTSCRPKIESLSLVSTRDELAANDFRWIFKIVDPDGDLLPQNIELTGAEMHAIQYESQPNALGSVYTGLIHIQASCNKDLFTPSSDPVQLRVVDNDNHEAVRQITATLNCPPLAYVKNAHYRADEGERLVIPIIHDDDVRLSLNSHFGTIEDDAFVWDVSCIYGRGPLNVEIRAESDNAYGRPAVFDIEVAHCQPRFEFDLDNDSIDPALPIVVSNDEIHRLEITQDIPMDDVSVSVHHRSENAQIDVVQKESRSGWEFEINCNGCENTEVVEFRFAPEDDADVKAIDPILLTVQCVDK